MKTSQVVAKAVVRLFLLLLLIATIPILTGSNTRLAQFNFIIHQKWTLVFPAILVVAFIALFITCTVNKYKKTDLNWLLVVSTLVLLAYLIATVIRVYQQVN